MPASAQFLVIIAALVVFWLVIMAPARRQQKRVGQIQQELRPGDKVVLSAGIFGTVRTVEGNKVTLEVAPGTVLTVARQVVVRRQDEEQVPPADEPTAPEGPTAPGQLPPAGDGGTPDDRPGPATGSHD
ncbi:MAG TPA: preprotein translocase subunit YajC [Marmoricola sp.]|nr:preprotein translocase subunit YajC [Marmoricola sp.]